MITQNDSFDETKRDGDTIIGCDSELNTVKLYVIPDCTKITKPFCDRKLDILSSSYGPINLNIQWPFTSTLLTKKDIFLSYLSKA